MLTLPKIIDRPAQPYVAVRASCSIAELPKVAPKAIGEIHSWLAAKNVSPAGPLFFRYNVIDMARLMEIDIGFPTSSRVEGDGQVLSDILPAGRFASIVYRGPYDGLYDANAVLIGWAKERGIAWDVVETDDGDRFGCRVEIYRTDPREEPNPANWQTEVAIRLADGG